ncbi:hypothetical protein HanXRQr2_Chr04g0153181 [Helianthus annuus]|uniref:Uncharacterized protein n=1 Tax=Helianthus annuus TaxID=4232 RepID=A0A251T7Q7_HELAN|nr:hypothetical protein HanXRQr2_Chr04g0153181 [Helianthus annuus]KAJ0930285.1 hypothetical protein HanPSC8_Chr04g0147561 [Helianthus annuus]
METTWIGYEKLSSGDADLRVGSNCRLHGLEFPVISPHIETGKGTTPRTAMLTLFETQVVITTSQRVKFFGGWISHG